MDVAAAENQITPAAIAAAAARIAPYVRRTNFFLPKVTKKNAETGESAFFMRVPADHRLVQGAGGPSIRSCG
ncbi:MAG: hypothetical protein WDO70_02295 [Alphaproteobacteria bacterium]